MLAARGHRGERSLRLDEIEVPSIAAGEVLIRNRMSGINRGTIGLWRNGTKMPNLPSVLSYEIAGEIVELGAEVEGFAPGDRVLVHSLLSCGHCARCLAGEDADCLAAANMGHIVYDEPGLPLYARYHNGGLAQYVRAPAASLERLPAGVTFEAAARILSYGVAFRSLSRLALEPGATLAINGVSGAFGAAAALLAPLFGVGRVIGLARSAASFERVRGLVPAMEEVAFDSLGHGWEENDGLRRALRERADFGGLDAAVDFSPAGAAATRQTLGALRKGGTLVLTGGNHETLAFPLAMPMQASLTIRGSRGSGRAITRRLLALAVAGRVDLTRLVSHRFALAEVNDAVRSIDDRREKPLFVAVSL